jgi:hypothetical protein
MDGLFPPKSPPRTTWRQGWLSSLVALLVALFATWACAEDHVDGFEGEPAPWKVRVVEGELAVQDQRRLNEPKVAYRGDGAEYFLLKSARGPVRVLLEHKLPVAQVIDDLKVKLMVRGTGGSIRAALRVVFPRQTDPRKSGAQLKCVLYGDTYTKAGEWQELKVQTTSKAMQDQLRRLRAELKATTLDLRQPVVDQVLLDVSLDAGRIELLVDELRFGPIAKPVAQADVQLVQSTDEIAPWPVTFQLDRLTVHGRPFFPRFMPYHEERLEGLREAGLNVIWIADAEDIALQRSLREHGLWAMAAPPRLRASTGSSLDNDVAGLLPIPREWDNVLSWNLGVALPLEAQRDIVPWISQVQSADRERRRPIMVDVTGGERVYSRHVDWLGASRNVLNSATSFKANRESLDQHRKLARPGTFVFTWLPTEPLPEVALQRQAAGRIPIIIEPEQLRLGAYSALAAGCRGLGFSVSDSLESKAPGADERRLTISQLNRELALLEDFLAAGSLVEQRQFEITAPSGAGLNSHNVAFRNSAISRADREAREAARKSALLREFRIRHSELEAAVFRTDKATLLLPIWYEDDAQFVPGQLAAPGATIDVASVPDTASAWEVTTTRVVNLPSEPIPGGRRVRLPTFDTTTAIVMTSDLSVIADLRRKMESMQAQSARNWLELAKAKLNRVRIADDELTKLGVGQPDAPQLLERARRLIQEAESLLPGETLDRAIAQARDGGTRPTSNSPDAVQQRKKFDEATHRSQAALQALRILQKAHWETATRRLASPVGSPHTLCFQTLPDHWRLIERLGKSATRSSENLLAKGNFEVLDFPTLARFGWQQTASSSGIRSGVQLVAASGREGRCLRLAATPETNRDPPSVIEAPPITVSSPPVAVRAGQVLHVSGWVRVATAISGSLDGVTLSDNLTGNTGAWHWREKREWQRFEMLREAYVDGPFVLTFTLHGLGDVQFDDLQLIAHDPPGESQLATHTEPAANSDPKAGRFDFLRRLPKFPQRPTKPADSNPLAPGTDPPSRAN